MNKGCKTTLKSKTIDNNPNPKWDFEGGIYLHWYLRLYYTTKEEWINLNEDIGYSVWLWYWTWWFLRVHWNRYWLAIPNTRYMNSFHQKVFGLIKFMIWRTNTEMRVRMVMSMYKYNGYLMIRFSKYQQPNHLNYHTKKQKKN